MTRARQVANFDPALFAADEVSGDKVSGGTIGAGTIGGTSVINTSGAITTTGNFTSVGIDDNADANAITIDSSENVGIGSDASTPIGKLHVATGDTGGSVNAGVDELVVEGSGNAGMTILSGDTSNGAIWFAKSGDIG